MATREREAEKIAARLANAGIRTKCLDGTKFMFRKAMQWAEKSGKYTRVFDLYEAVKTRPRIQEYLASDRRQSYSLGIYRHYPELDIGEEM